MGIKSWLASGIAVSCLSLPAHAADLTPAASRDPTDPAFLPGAGQWVGSTSFRYGSAARADVDTPSGSRQYSFDAESRALTQTLDYGLTQSWSIWADWSHAWTSAHYYGAAGSSTHAQVQGSGLQIGVTDRLLDQTRYPVNLDVSVALAEVLSVAISRDFEALTIRATAGVHRGGNRNAFDVERDVDVDTSTYWGYDAALQGRLRLTSAASLDLTVQYVSANVDSVNASSAGTSFTIHYPDQVNLGMSLNFQLVPERLVLQLGGSYQFLGQRRDTYADPTLDLVSRRRTQRVAGIRLVYSF